MRILISFVMVLSFAACVRQPPRPVSIACNYSKHAEALQLDFSDIVPPKPGIAVASTKAAKPMSKLQRLLRDTMAPKSQMKNSPSENILILSGGGQVGAYGAQFLKGMSEQEPARLANVGIVTGISTGALIAPFVIIGDYDGAVEAYTITAETDIVKRKGLTALLKQRAILDKSPLIARYAGYFAPGGADGRFQQLKARLSDPNGPTLEIGVVNLDDERFYTVDINSIFGDADLSDDGKFACFQKTVLASAAVPIAFEPEFIDGNAYMDGGARLSVFINEVNTAMKATTGSQTEVYVLVNSTLTQRSKTPPQNLDGETLGAFNIAAKSVDILSNQVKNTSIRSIINQLSASGTPFFVAAANQRVGDVPCPDNANGLLGQGFDPIFMTCLRERAGVHWQNGINSAFVYNFP
ncbi:MAG: patatin-like phospholipase family protein [Pseudomonadota bacterium]